MGIFFFSFSLWIYSITKTNKQNKYSKLKLGGGGNHWPNSRPEINYLLKEKVMEQKFKITNIEMRQNRITLFSSKVILLILEHHWLQCAQVQLLLCSHIAGLCIRMNALTLDKDFICDVLMMEDGQEVQQLKLSLALMNGPHLGITLLWAF